MPKQNSMNYVCTACNKNYSKWMGYCMQCKAFDSISEATSSSPSSKKKTPSSLPVYQHKDIIHNCEAYERNLSGISEWDRVIGGGLVAGSFTLLSGDPGVGKSTLLLQVAHGLCKSKKVLYISSEENLDQVALRTKRLKINVESASFLLTHGTSIEQTLATIDQEKPNIVIIDSIQNLQSDNTHATHSSQLIKTIAYTLLEVSKTKKISVIVVGHITKDGSIAGPKMLEHIVDTVLYLSNDEIWNGRILRSLKNRFGPLDEPGFFAMNETGLSPETDAQALFIEHSKPTIGSALTSFSDGSRTFIIEVQALASPAKYGNPQRVSNGIDHKQVLLVCAIIERYLRIPLHSYDIFCKVTGNTKVKTARLDCALALAIISSVLDKEPREAALVIGEMGLTGNIKHIQKLKVPEQAIKRYGIKSIATHSKHIQSHSENIYKKITSIQDLAKLL